MCFLSRNITDSRLIVELILDEDNPKENGDEPDHRTVLVIARYAYLPRVYFATNKTSTKSTGIFF